jgi:pyruvate dehydrogenase E1 component beta subunit
MSEELLYWQALNRAMDAELAADSSVFTLGEDVGLYGGSYRVTEGLHAKYGEWRVRDTPISENSFTGLGVGAALVGLRPVVEIMTINFMLLALDSIINAAAKIPFMSGGQFPMPLVVRVAGGVARQLGAQHSQRLEYTLMNVPGLRIAVPSTPQDAYWQLRQAIVSDEPIILLEHELLYFSKGPVDVLAEAPPMHRALVRREGRDLTIVSYSRHAVLSQEAASELSKEGIEAEVIDLRSLKPIDWDTCAASLEKTHRMLVVEEDCRFAGAGAEIVATLTDRCFDSLDAPVQRLAGLDISTPFNGALEAATIPQVPDIVAAARGLFRPTPGNKAETKTAPSPKPTSSGEAAAGVTQATLAAPKTAPPETARAPKVAAAAANKAELAVVAKPAAAPGKGAPAPAAKPAAAPSKTADARRTSPKPSPKGQRR